MAGRSNSEKGSMRGEKARVGLVENPLDFIAEDHMREREVCASIDRIVALEKVGSDEIQAVCEFLEVAMPLHLADEEQDLFPLMRNRCEPEDEIEKIIGKLLDDHGHAADDAPSVVALLKRINAGRTGLSSKDRQELNAFARHSRRHLVLENAVILPIARARLLSEDLLKMQKNMRLRRGLAVQ